MAITTAYKKIKDGLFQGTFYKVIQGGMSAGKTYAIMTLLVLYAQNFPNRLITVVGMSYPHLRHGTMRDLKRILQEMDIWEENRWSVGASQYHFINGSIIEFMSVDKMGAHGLRRDVLFVNEATGTTWETFDQLASRTRRFTLVDFNPTAKFWVHERLVEGEMKHDTTFLSLTYKDNEALSNREVANIENHAPKPGEEPSNWWTVYGLGQIGSLEGNIYSGWEEGEMEGKIVRYGLDFGFSNDETALVAIYQREDGKTGIEEMLYERNLLGSQYVEKFKELHVDPNVLIVADSARPEIIAEIKRGGFRCVGADKNAGSILRGIDKVSQRQVVFSGADLKREYFAYAWRTKRSGETLDEPEDGNDHCMDALRYAIDDLSRQRFDF